MSHNPRRSQSNDEAGDSSSASLSSRSISTPLPHVPQTPSRLRQSFAPGSPSPENLTISVLHGRSPPSETQNDRAPAPDSPIEVAESGILPARHNGSEITESLEATRARGLVDEPHEYSAATETSRLLQNYHHVSGSEDNGLYSTAASSINSRDYGTGGREGSVNSDTEPPMGGLMKHFRPIVGRMETWMSSTGAYGEANGAEGSNKHGRRGRIRKTWRTYLPYYIPILKWAPQYRLAWLVGDLTAAITMASFYIPMALSYANNLGHVPPINGLYSFVINPLIYAILGTCPQMVVGPEAPGSLLLGSVVRSSVEKGTADEDEDFIHARIAGVVTSIAGLTILISGLFRLGFLDNVLSRPFLRGFISAIGVVIFIDQLIPELGLQALAKETGNDHSPAFMKLVFLIQNLGKAHRLTALVSIGAFVIIMIFRQGKLKLQPRFPAAAYIPDRFLVVVLSAIFAYAFQWDKAGLAVLGEVKASGGAPFQIHWPFDLDHITHIREALSTAFLIALLGFFESTVAAKALGDGENSDPSKSIQGMSLSPNRELVAMGVANFIGGCFMALPAFGGYGRSKVNKSTGGTTPMSSIILSIITLNCVYFLVPYFYYLPRGVLSAMISVVAYSLVEEAPHDIHFFIKVQGWTELALMFIIFAATILYSLTLGIALGIGLSLLRVIKHATKPRIQLLIRVPGSDNQFENAEYLVGGMNRRPSQPSGAGDDEGDTAAHALIIKIPEPLHFANTGDLRSRLRRLELYGSNHVHPALPRTREDWQNKTIIFDVHGATSIDAAGVQILSEIVNSYVDRGTRVFFCRVPGGPSGKIMDLFEKSGIVGFCGGGNAFTKSVDEALTLAIAYDNNPIDGSTASV